jgi:hypothetical protein
MSPQASAPDPGLIMQILNAYQQTYALKAAIELDLFTHIAAGITAPAPLAKASAATERGVRILCDYLTILGMLTKSDGLYGLSPTAAAFLTKSSPTYMGPAAAFLTHEKILGPARNLTETIQTGFPANVDTLEPDNFVWVDFARDMAPFMRLGSRIMAEKVGPAKKVLDISAGHGLFGLSVGKLNPEAQIYGQDWANVLEVAKENAAKMGLAERFHTIPGSAFEVDLGSGYDLVLLPNFLHHFDAPTNVGLLKRVHAALAPGGRAATVEFMPNEDRVTPPMAASFSVQMLIGTSGGDAFTFRELEKMFADAGFAGSTAIPLDPSPETLIISAR